MKSIFDVMFDHVNFEYETLSSIQRYENKFIN